ncbi:MAG: bifunctional nuclease family protein [Dehalococcoidia bacterium]|nr:bifunctional nuclease family protein [Dehalococcoidia bacterium]
MTIDSIRISVTNSQRVVILKEKSRECYLSMWIETAEADAIAIKLQGVLVPRPLTHDLLCSVIDALGAAVDHVIIDKMKEDTFYARIFLRVNDKMLEVDSRPSDALALAVRISAPIYVGESIMEKAGILLDRETGNVIPQALKAIEDNTKPVDEAELKKLFAFKDFVQNLNLGDLEKDKKKEDP